MMVWHRLPEVTLIVTFSKEWPRRRGVTLIVTSGKAWLRGPGVTLIVTSGRPGCGLCHLNLPCSAR